jgi:Ran GTPase-activating protein (RanGAP) involved in mRNA processing and transport
MANIFSLEGRALKLDSAADMDKHIAELKANNDVEEVVFVGNTLGVEACEALAKVLETKKKLKVRRHILMINLQRSNLTPSRSPTLPTFSHHVS